MPRLLSRALAVVAILVSLGLFARLIFTPDPVGNVFYSALRLENAQQIPLALQHYELIVARHPESPYAPRALARQGELLAEQGRQNNNSKALRRAVTAYLQLAKNYPSDSFVLQALQNAGTIAAQELRDHFLARTIYRQIIETQGQHSEPGAQAVVKLARLAIEDGDGKTAQNLLQQVLRRWNKNAVVGAEAQYFLGLCYETVFKKRDWASRAYDAVIANYPGSQWASDARERLGLIVFSDSQGRRPTRRVLLDIEPVPDESDDENSDGDIWSALRVAMAARGLSADPVLVRGYSLAPFYAGLNPNNPGQPVEIAGDTWQNVAGAAGFRFSIKGGGNEAQALRDLQDALDAAQLPLVRWNNQGQPTWSLAVGYDSERGEVMLQNRGARMETFAAKTWAPQWKSASTWNKTYTLVALVPTGTKGAVANPKRTPPPVPTPLPGHTPAPVVGGPPAFVWGISRLKNAVAIERTARGAAPLVVGNSNNKRLLGAAALDLWARTLSAAARDSRTRQPRVAPSPLPTASPSPTASPTPTPTPTSSLDENSIYDPTPAPQASPSPIPTPQAPGEEPVSVPASEALARAGRLWPFWNAPIRSWIAKRRECADWCRLAALKTRDARFNRAAQLFDTSADALESAEQNALALDATDLRADPDALETLARDCRRARDAEREAARLLG